MASTNQPPFRADHVGSLLRPPALAKARAERKAGRIGAAELSRVEDEAIRQAVRMQEEAGLAGVTDGELRRHDWIMDFTQALGGITVYGKEMKVPFHSAAGDVDWSYETYGITSRLTLREPIFAEHFKFLKATTKATAKLTIPSPGMMYAPMGGPPDPKIYPDIEQYRADIETVYVEEMAALARLGCTYLQFDDTVLAFINDPNFRKTLPGGEQRHLGQIKFVNRILARKPPGMSITTHLCRGNFRSAWLTSGSYDYVAEPLFGELDVDGYFLEYDDERSGGFEPLRFVPKGNKKVVLGIVSSKKAELETKDDLKRRIEAAGKYVPLDQLCLSPQCGFASTEEGNLLTLEQQAAKLRLVVETAREVWG